MPLTTTPPPEGFRGIFRTDEMACCLYAYGAGIARAIPAAVAVPEDTEDVSLLVRWAKATGNALIPRGSGSGMAGGAVGNHVMFDLSRLRTTGVVDVSERKITVGAGTIRNEVDAAARKNGLCFPVDPSSGAFCTIGGMVATNAAGSRTLRYGSMRNWVRGIRCVFDCGESAWIRRGNPIPQGVPAIQRLLAALNESRSYENGHQGVRKDSSGYAINVPLLTGDSKSAGVSNSLDDASWLLNLLVGSEGTLAIFTDVELALAPLPAESALFLASFSSLNEAAECASFVRDLGASACEMLDRTYLDVAETSAPTGIDKGAQAVLLIEFESDDAEQLASATAELPTIAKSRGAFAVTTATHQAEQARVWSLRHSASPTLAALPSSTRSMQFIEDGCVPPEHFADYVLGVRESLRKHDTTAVIFGHAGDAHAHVNPLIDMTRSNWRTVVRSLFDEVCMLTFRLGGTLAGEHGDGRLRSGVLLQSWGERSYSAFHAVKQAGDPSGIFNPGCKLADTTVNEFAEIRYDPKLPLLHAVATQRLEKIERTRGWHQFRLAGLE